MKLRLNHIGFVVDDISEHVKLFEALGLSTPTEAVPYPLLNVTASFVTMFPAPDMHLELLQSTDENSPISKFLKDRGGGLHHLCFEVDDIDEAVGGLLEKGFRCVVPVEPCEAYDVNLKRTCASPTRIAFFVVGRLLVELIEIGR